MRPRADEIPAILKEQIRRVDHAAPLSETGTVLATSDGLARIQGLSRAMAGERVEITARDGTTVAGLVLTLERDTVRAAFFGDAGAIEEGDSVRCTGRLLEVPVGEALLGRVVDALGAPIDDIGPIETTLRGRVEAKAPAFIERRPMSEPLLTGTKVIDACVPLGRGHSLLLLSDRKIGKTTLAVDAILNQKGKDVFCVYVAIGQRLSSVRQMVSRLAAHGAMEYTTVVVAAANEPALARCLAPLTGAAMGEYFRDTRRHALCVFDDLSQHAVAHREIALLLGHVPGPHGHPIDLASVYGRLLERVTNRADRGDPRSSGSLTALAIVETQDGDTTACVPRTLLEIADGQIALDKGRFDSGVRPAVDVGASVSHASPWGRNRVLMRLAGWKSWGSNFRHHLTNHPALAELVRFVPDLDARTRAQLDHGARLVEIMKQPPHEPIALEQQILLLFAATHRLLEDIPVSNLQRFEADLRDFAGSNHQALLAECTAARSLDDAIKARMRAVIETVKKRHLLRG